MLMPGNDLLSHGETPHYQPVGGIPPVPILSSVMHYSDDAAFRRDRVGPERYGCQAIRS